MTFSLPWPNTAGEATDWLLVLALVYTAVAVYMSGKRKNSSKDYSYLITANAATFSLSSMLLLGVADNRIFGYIGGITVPAMIAGIAGLLFSVRSIFKDH